jgi:hypothetical protein
MQKRSRQYQGISKVLPAQSSLVLTSSSSTKNLCSNSHSNPNYKVEVPGVEPGSGEGINELSTCLAESIIFSSAYPIGRALAEDGSPNS